MKKVILLINLCTYFLVGCRQVFPAPEATFIVLNETKQDLNSIEISIKDDSMKANPKPVWQKILTIENVPAGKNSNLLKVLLKNYSKTGKGIFKITAKEADGNSFTIQGGNYIKYLPTSESYLFSYTLEVVYLDDKTFGPKPFITFRPGYYKKGKKYTPAFR